MGQKATKSASEEEGLQKYGLASPSAEAVQKAMEKYFGGLGYTYTPIPSFRNSTCSWRIKTKEQEEWQTILIVDTNRDMLLLNLVLPFKYEPSNNNQTAAVYALLSDINVRILNGNFEVDPGDGEIKFKIAYSILGLSPENLVTMTEIGLIRASQSVKTYIKKIEQSLAGKTPPSPMPSEKLPNDKAILPSPKPGEANTPVLGSSDWNQKQEHVIPFDDLGQKVKKIGEGGCGVVYLHNWNGTPVAVKKIKGVNARDIKEMFYSEFAIMAAFRHPNVVLLLGVCLQPNLCIITEFMEKGSLDTVIHDDPHYDKKMKLSEKLGMAIQIARGLAYIHSRSVIHGDLKPQNIFIDGSYSCKIADFGLSQFKKVVTSTRSSKTQPTGNTMIGIQGFTPIYAAPEMIEKKQMSQKSDVFSFSYILWEMLYQKTPLLEYMKTQHNVEDFPKLRPSFPQTPAYSPQIQQYLKILWNADSEKRPKMAEAIEGLTDLKSKA